MSCKSLQFSSGISLIELFDKEFRAGISLIELFETMRGYYGTFHRMSPKHLDRYVDEFSGRHNIRRDDTIDQMGSVAHGMVGQRLRYRDLIAPNGRPSGAREIAR